jgi:hypothetical protein
MGENCGTQVPPIMGVQDALIPALLDQFGNQHHKAPVAKAYLQLVGELEHLLQEPS